MERNFINPIKIIELTMPPEDAEHYKVPGIFFSKPCNLFKKSFCWYSTQQTSAISLFLRSVLLLTVTACSYCCLMLIVTAEKLSADLNEWFSENDDIESDIIEATNNLSTSKDGDE